MDFSFGIIGLIVGVALGYAVFYFRYADKKLVDDLRSTVIDLQQQIQSESVSLKEYEQQNLLLKEKVTELLLKNDDLTKITSELYRYYHRIREGHTKALELVDLLKSFDQEFDAKIQSTTSDNTAFQSLPVGEGVKRF